MAVGNREEVVKVPKSRVPKTAAVVITCEREDMQYADILSKARETVNLENLGIQETRVRRAANSSVIIEVVGENMNGKADELADRLRAALYDENIEAN